MNKIIGVSHYKNAGKFKNPVGVMPYVPTNPHISDANNLAWLAVPLELAKKFNEKEISFEEFRDGYYELVLDHNVAQEEIDKIVEKFGPSPVLCGFQKDVDLCHRKVLAEWINNNTNYTVVEATEQCDVYGKTAQEYLAGLKK